MDHKRLDRLAAADVETDARLFLELVREGEQLFVERKGIYPRGALEGFGGEVASMANMLGGWILFGVRDSSGAVQDPGLPKGDLQSNVGNDLRKVVDPVPPFIARTVEVNGVTAAFVRVFESSVRPVIAAGGRLYSRDAGGKRPVEDHREILELVQAGREAARSASGRIQDNGLSKEILGLTRDTDWQAEGCMKTVVRAAPETVTPHLIDWPIAGGPSVCEEAARILASRSQLDGEKRGFSMATEPHGRAVVARAEPLADPRLVPIWRATTLADCAGVFGACAFRMVNNVMTSHRIRSEFVRPVIDAVVTMLEAAEAYGDVTFELDLVQSQEVFLDHPSGRYADHGVPPHVHCGGATLTVPAGEEARLELGSRWEREVARSAGVPLWEVEPE